MKRSRVTAGVVTGSILAAAVAVGAPAVAGAEASRTIARNKPEPVLEWTTEWKMASFDGKSSGIDIE